ncbi:unnamed protein product, partial [Symbiodinium sp. CCMP2456]
AQLHTPLCTAFLTATGPVEKREVIVIGAVLCTIWSSLRWNDALWSPPSRVVLQSGAAALSGLATRTKSSRASMPWGCLLIGFTGSSSCCWGLCWLTALKQCCANTSRLFSGRVVDFLLPVLSADPAAPVFVAPLHRSRAMPWLRSLLDEHWRANTDTAPPSEHALYGVHSCKATVLSWARQLNLVINRIRSGYRPLQPVARDYTARSRTPPPSPAASRNDSTDTDLSDDSSGSARGSDGYPGFPPRPAADATGALLLPAALDLRDLEDLTDAEITTILRRCSVAFLTRLARLCVRIVRAEPEVIYCQAHFVDCIGILWTCADMSSAPPAFDDPLALSALLAKWTAPDTLHPLLVAKGFRTIASIAYAIPGDGSPDDFLRVLWPPSDPNNPTTLVTPEASFARRLLVQSRDLVHPPASSAGPAAATIPSVPPPKITAENAETLRAKFIDSYPGELLSPASTPSVEFLNRLRAELDKPTTLWVPWRLRTSEHDLQTFYENRRPRSDGQLLRHLLDGVPEPVTAQAPAHTSGPVEPALRRHLGLLITALAFLGDLHLKLGKAYAESFIAAATAAPLDPSLRPPSMQEVLAADKAVWGAIAGLMRDEKFSLADALQEITVTRLAAPAPPSVDSAVVAQTVDEACIVDSSSSDGSVAEVETAARQPSFRQPGLQRSRSPKRPKLGYSFSYVRPSIPLGRKLGSAPHPCAGREAGTAPPASAPQPAPTCPEPTAPLPALFLDLFSGAAAPLSKALGDLGCDRIAPVDALFGEQIDVLDAVHQESLKRLCCSGLVRVLCAGPPCSSFSRARLRFGGPAPVRTPKYPQGIPRPSPKQQSELEVSDRLHSFTRELLSLVLINGGIAILENPSTSLLWHHPSCTSWIRHHCLSAVEVAACNHGLDVFKSWTFVSNLSDLSGLASSCQHPKGVHSPISGRRDSSGQFLTRHTACYPASLCSRLASILDPLLSRHVGVIPFLSWETRLLAPKLHWPIPASRVEDGAGSCSTGSWSVPQGEDSFRLLRQAWMQRITRPEFLGKFRANLASGSKDPPLSDVDLRPFLEDLRSFLRLSEKEFETLLCVPPGQPFRLFLLEALLEVSRDPDISFIDLLVEGVPLGVDEAMSSCPALFPPSAPVSPKVPLQHCESACMGLRSF